jgi:hypothetical protein
VRFDEKLRVAVGINVAGTRNILELAHDMKKLEGVWPRTLTIKITKSIYIVHHLKRNPTITYCGMKTSLKAGPSQAVRHVRSPPC